MTRVKICGITSVEDALAAVAAGADALGFVFAPSPRQVTPEAAAAIVRELPPFVATVGVLVDQDPGPILEVCPLEVIQFHGAETPEQVAAVTGVRRVKAFRVRADGDLEALRRYHDVAHALLLDAYDAGAAGGTGKAFPWALARLAVARGLVAGAPAQTSPAACRTLTAAKGATAPPLILAGGLTPENVAEAIAATSPYAVDVSSGVEVAPGRKDPARMAAFVRAVRDQ